jgi:hypothetical protein
MQDFLVRSTAVDFCTQQVAFEALTLLNSIQPVYSGSDSVQADYWSLNCQQTIIHR